MNNLFILLQTWESIVIKLMLNCISSTIAYLSSSCASCYCNDDDGNDNDDDDDELVFCLL